jgi:hypothetical protein
MEFFTPPRLWEVSFSRLDYLADQRPGWRLPNGRRGISGATKPGGNGLTETTPLVV